MMIPIKVKVNGTLYQRSIEPDLTLLQFLRDTLGLTGTKEGCSKGECGTCTVIMDGQTVNSCLVLAVQCNNAEITTIEGLGDIRHLDPLQEAFVIEGGVQCGFCTPGMIVSIYWLLKHNPNPSDEQIQEAISGNICRCTGYTKIIDSVHTVIKNQKAGKKKIK